jgi:hypothetical protein
MRFEKLKRFDNLIKRVVKNFNDAGTEYVFTGAFAVSFFGTPRTTIDVDIMVKISKKEVQSRLVEPLKKAHVLVDEKKISEAFKSGYKIMTFKDKRTPFTIDVILSDKKLSKEAGTAFGLPTFFQAPEELILAKLRMIKVTLPPERSQKDKDDIKSILRHTKVNIKTIEQHAQKETTLTIFKELIKK